ncbi:MAG: hypothetical protein M3547_10770 [Acidobacteriota bacterium]|nr:hypothetical protein [Acidobacteriota bacterium]
MAAYVSVYTRKIRPSSHQARTAVAAERDPALRRFLAEYPDSFFDWGDDPAFFAARVFLGDVRRASWGVCRRNLRARLAPGDLVVFFCAREAATTKGRWDYYFVGFATVGSAPNREQIWREERYSAYRSFYNLLVRPEGQTFVHAEAFHPPHSDWARRRSAPYILFDSRPGMTEFDLVSPPHVAVYSGSLPERWNQEPTAAHLENLLFRSRGRARRLRTSKTGFGHTYMKLSNDERETAAIRATLNRIMAKS